VPTTDSDRVNAGRAGANDGLRCRETAAQGKEGKQNQGFHQRTPKTQKSKWRINEEGVDVNI